MWKKEKKESEFSRRTKSVSYTHLALRVGMPMKNLYESQSIAWEDITRFFIVIDEAHRIVNANNLTAVQQLTVMAREDRKFFTGILMATQSILDLSLIHI